MALLIGPVFDRVLRPDTPDSPVLLFTIPGFNHAVYLSDIVPASFHNVWTMVGCGILIVFLLKGILRVFRELPGKFRRPLCHHGPASKNLRQGAAAGCQFFETNSTGTLMSSIMNDIEKIQVAVSTMLADWLRQSFSVIFLLWVVLQKDWRLAVVSITVLPFVLVPTLRLGRRIRRITRRSRRIIRRI